MAYFGFQWGVRSGYRKQMRDRGVVAELKARAERIAEAAGPGFVAEVDPESGRRRTPRASVRTDTFEAMLAQARGNVLERSIDAGR